MSHLITPEYPFITTTATPTSPDGSDQLPHNGTSHEETPLTPIIYGFSASSFSLALSTAIIFLILSLLHTYLCVKKKTVFFAITIYASLAMTSSLTLKTYLINLQSLLLSSPTTSTPMAEVERADILLVVMDLLEAIPASAMGFLLMMTYTRLTWLIVPKSARSGNKGQKVLGLPVRWQTSVLAMGQMVGDGMVGVGNWYGVHFLESLGGIVGVCGISRVIRREQVSYYNEMPPWISSEDDEQLFFVVSEWPVYVFQHLPIALILVLLAIYHPGDYLPRRLTGWRLNTKRLLREEKMREDVESLRVLTRKDSKSSSVQGSELDCFERIDLDKETK
ncbi:hypothetical protein B0T21DRAFT_383349 [Apiosordaria backusii]|uniref:Uncharacterized protein n=1 Tax=Apiosordaria backusii TaxID=314023 RepID=A0AA40EGX8_9PEZI|nr:hypothetical protein B0T21DRAFT_383349 [Apiosordaria backusii]